ncbi:MAG: type II toxin-antitoxin system HicB family antitoxin [bacterium]|nr:type II toxin-antitoxin system HicB family antitoxin [bacterium]
MKEFNVVVIKRDRCYIARCMELGIACQGETEEEAKAGLIEAVEAYLESYNNQARVKEAKPKPASI